MNVLVFSDTHLSSYFEEKKFKFLSSLIKKADQVIINGDFWDGYLTDFDSFVASPWNQLFPLLKAKKTIYLYGNHDKHIYAQKKVVAQFSTLYADSYQLKLKDKTLLFEHGDRIVPFFEEFFFLPASPSRTLSAKLDLVERFIIRTLKNKRLGFFSTKHNLKIRTYIKNNLKSNEILFVGHTHKAEFDLANQFVNTGVIKHGLAQYVWIKNGKISAHEEWYD